MLHSRKNVPALQAVPGGGYDNSALVVLTKERNALGNLLVSCALGMRKHDSRRIGNLVVIELTEVLHIHLALVYVSNGGKAVEYCAMLLCSLGSAYNVRKLANARGLDDNSVGSVFLKHLNKRLGKITNQRAADAAGIHLGDLNACIGKEAAVNTDLAKLVLDKHNLLACVGLFNKLLDQRGLACAEEAGKYINFSHKS